MMFERSHLGSNLWRFVMQFGLCFFAVHSVFAAVKPVISDHNGLTPNSAVAGSDGFTLTVKGTNFIVANETVSVNWNGSPRPITSLKASQLQVTIFASDIAVAGTAQVTVSNTDESNNVATSDPATFTILPAPLAINTTTLPAGVLNVAYSQSLSASGGTPPYTWAIISGSLPAGLSLNASSGTLSGTPTSSGSFTFSIRVQDSAQPIANSIRQFTLSVQNPVPAITGISPNSAIAGSPEFALTVNGSNFVSGSTVRWNGSNRTTSLNSATSLTASIPASDIATAGTASVTVNNPAP
ncbi:MAG TPA: putative Ig domain-containing protein, partial [Terriglobia bacterium]|nr:putative Ig domain-containing protein [Terriglobia bacterium]